MKTRFETEAQGTSEMAYLHDLFKFFSDISVIVKNGNFQEFSVA